MPTKIENFTQNQLKTGLPDIRPGDTVCVYQKMPASAESLAGKKEEEKVSSWACVYCGHSNEPGTKDCSNCGARAQEIKAAVDAKG